MRPAPSARSRGSFDPAVFSCSSTTSHRMNRSSRASSTSWRRCATRRMSGITPSPDGASFSSARECGQRSTPTPRSHSSTPRNGWSVRRRRRIGPRRSDSGCGQHRRPQGRAHEITRVQIGRLLLVTASPVAVVHYASQSGARDLEADLIRDGLLGYSARGAPRGTVATLIDVANASTRPILAIDLPSGIDPDSGAVPGTAIRAAATVTLALPKTGLLRPEASPYVGTLLLADVGIPHAAFSRIGVNTSRLFERGDLVRILPP